MAALYLSFFFFFFNDTATTEIYTLSLHDALPIFIAQRIGLQQRGVDDAAIDGPVDVQLRPVGDIGVETDRKSTRLNSSHGYISYAVFCLKKKKKNKQESCSLRLD